MDQTGFSQNQELLQAPPEELQKQAEKQAALAAAVPDKKVTPKMILLGILGAIALILVLVVLLAQAGLLGQGGTKVIPTPVPVVLPSIAPRTQSEFGKRLENIENQINESDPSAIDLDPPPLNLQIRL